MDISEFKYAGEEYTKRLTALDRIEDYIQEVEIPSLEVASQADGSLLVKYLGRTYLLIVQAVPKPDERRFDWVLGKYLVDTFDPTKIAFEKSFQLGEFLLYVPNPQDPSRAYRLDLRDPGSLRDAFLSLFEFWF